MRVHVFSSEQSSKLFGFTPDQKGQNLPGAQGPWRYFKSVDLSSGGADLIGESKANIQSGIEINGFHIAGAEIRVGEELVKSNV